MKSKILILILPILAAPSFLTDAQRTDAQKYIVSIERIWDRAPHNAFTDLTEFRGSLYCAFREGAGHVPGSEGYDGTIRILRSDDGANWQSVALLAEEAVDLRDPKLSVTPDGRLMALMGGSTYHGSELIGYTSRVSFSNRLGAAFSRPRPVTLDPGIHTGRDWLWRVTWHGGRGYGVVYQPAKDATETQLQLVVTRDGLNYEHVARLDVTGRPNETTLRFQPDGQLLAWVRRESGDRNGWLGLSRPPYRDWDWRPQSMRLGGPNFIRLPDGGLIGATRGYLPANKYVTTIVRLTADGGTTPLVTLPSGGDTSYPGLVLRGDRLLVSYYSSHEGKSGIYFATLNLSELMRPR